MAEPHDAGGRPAAEPPAPAPAHSGAGSGASPARWQSERLFGARIEIEIEHGTLVYRLRKTSLGKLILTK